MKGVWLGTQLTHEDIVYIERPKLFHYLNEFIIMLKNYLVAIMRSFMYKTNDSEKIILPFVVMIIENGDEFMHRGVYQSNKLTLIFERGCILKLILLGLLLDKNNMQMHVAFK